MPNTFFRAVAFDMDGLLVDSEPLWLESEIQLTSSYGYIWTSQDQVACLGGPLTRLGEYMHSKCGFAKTPEYFTQTIIDLMVDKLSMNAPLMPGAFELITQLYEREIPIALVTASPRVIVDAVLRNLKFNPFLTTISCDDVLRTKPSPDGYLKAAADCGADIEQILIFEDSQTGVNAAQASGARLIAVPHLIEVVENERTRVIKSLKQLSYDKLSELYEDFTVEI